MTLRQYRVTYERPTSIKGKSSRYEFFCMADNGFLAEIQCIDYDSKENRDDIPEAFNVHAEEVSHQDSPLY